MSDYNFCMLVFGIWLIQTFAIFGIIELITYLVKRHKEKKTQKRIIENIKEVKKQKLVNSYAEFVAIADRFSNDESERVINGSNDV